MSRLGGVDGGPGRCATVALVGIATFMVHVHRDWSGRNQPPRVASHACRGKRATRAVREDGPSAAGPASRPLSRFRPRHRRHHRRVLATTPPSPSPTTACQLPASRRGRRRGRDVACASADHSGERVTRCRAHAVVRAGPRRTGARGAGHHGAARHAGPRRRGRPVAKLFTSKPGGLTIYQFDPTQSSPTTTPTWTATRPASPKAHGAPRAGDRLRRQHRQRDPAAPHLHFAIFVLGAEKHWWQGTPINPYPVFR